MIPRLRAAPELQYERKRGIENEGGIVIPWVFFYPDGRPIKNFWGAWKSARKRAGLPDLIPHNFRRSAVRNLERAGVAPSAAMKLVGHQTESIYRRHAITDEVMLKEGAEKLSAFFAETQQASRPKVILLDR